VTNDTAKTSIKNHSYHHTTPCKTEIGDSNDVTGNHIITPIKAILFFSVNS
jgi:hypothetical protein